jgi:SAM-dependent methyltransferase
MLALRPYLSCVTALCVVATAGTKPVEIPKTGDDFQITELSQSAIWQEFEHWVRTTPTTRDAERISILARYRDVLLAKGVEPAEAARRVEQINGMRLESPQRHAIYYDAVYKFGNGPEDPVRILVETARDRKPGAALDVAMGNGRNGLYLASLGWKVTGYDVSTEGVAAARAAAEKLKVPFEAIPASHESFAWGTGRWDLIIMAYVTAWEWPARLTTLWKSLRPGGIIVCEHACADLVSLLYGRKIRGFRLLHYRDTEDFNEGWGQPNVKVRRVFAVIEKMPDER